MARATAPKASDKATKILQAAEELFIKQGFKGVTMSAIAQRAHVGKGTTYLYWGTKEDLFLELISRRLVETLDSLAEQIEAHRELAMPHRLLPLLAQTWLAQPIIRALQAGDVETLGALIDNPQLREILYQNSAHAIIKRLMPVWREHDVIGVDWEPAQQESGLELLFGGYLAHQSGLLMSLLGPEEEAGEVLKLATFSMLKVTEPSDSVEALESDIRAVLLQQSELLASSSSEQ